MRVLRRIAGMLAITLVLFPQLAAAHVLITDESKRVGAILHVNPNDDPIAGQPSNLFFDLQGGAVPAGAFTARLRITDDAGNQAEVPVTVSGSTVSADYTFPVQGVYNFQLVVTTATSSYTFHYAQRVARGTTTSALDTPRYPWAQFALIASVTAFICLVIVVFNRRHDIAAQSRW